MKPQLWRRTRLGEYLRRLPRLKNMRGTWLHRILGDRLLERELWQPDRERFAAGMAIGVFFSLMPMPFQMAAAGFVAWLGRFNLPATLVAVWFSNPITMPFLMVLEYKIGLFLLGKHGAAAEVADPTFGTLLREAPVALLTGAVFCAILFGALTYPVSRFLWKVLEDSLRRRASRKAAAPRPSRTS